MTNVEYHILTRCKNHVLLKLVLINNDYDVYYMQERISISCIILKSYMDFDN